MSRRRNSFRPARVRPASRSLRLEPLEQRQLLATFVVTNTADSGSGSLRQAIIDSNAAAGADVITFSIGGGGVRTIPVGSALPTITDPLMIDARTQPGYGGKPLIELNGTRAGVNANGLRIASPTTVLGLAINRFSSAGIRLEVSGNIIQKNYIGTDATGASARGNQGGGIVIDSSSDNVIGGGVGQGNVISGNVGDGIRIAGTGSRGNRISGNRIGTDEAGLVAVPNTGDGVNLFGASFNQIGGLTADGRNIISGNALRGISVFASGEGSNTIQNNYIGVGSDGTTRLGNGAGGISISSSNNNQIGGPDSTARNVISGNGGDGIGITDGSHNRIQGNYIGTTASGKGEQGNAGAGVGINTAADNQIGGAAPGAGNVIAFNGSAFGAGGVNVFGPSSTGNAILSNSIYANNGLGIDLFPAGVNTNDDTDPDTGPNEIQNYPSLVLAKTGAGRTLVQGSLNSQPNATFIVQFFSSQSADPSGYGEGQTLIGMTSVTTDGSGLAPLEVTLDALVQAGYLISATATDAAGNTSEYSSSTRVVPGAVSDLSIRSSEDLDPATPFEPLTYTLTVTNNGPDPAMNVRITDSLPQGVTYVSSTASTGGTTDRSGAEVVATFPTLVAGASATVTIVVLPTETGQIRNTATVTSGGVDPDGTNNTVTETTSVRYPADVRVTIQAQPSEATIGEDLVYLVLVTNEGPGEATGVVVTVVVPDDVTFVDATSGQGGVQRFGKTLTASIGALANGNPVEVRVVVTPSVAGTTQLDATAVAFEIDPEPANNSASLATTVIPAADLALTLQSAPSSALSGQELIYTIDVRNNGPSPATAVVLTQDIPAQPAILELATTQGTVTEADGVITANLGDLGPDATVQITVRILVPEMTGLLSSTARIGSPVADRDITNNTTSLELPVDPADVSVVMQTDPVVGEVGRPIFLNVTVANAGPATAQDAFAEVTLPAGVVLIAQIPSQGAATVRGDGQVRVDFGTILPGGVASLRLQLLPQVAGSLTLHARSGAENDVATANNQTTLTTAISPADLVTSLSGPGGTLAVGDLLTYRIIVTNYGPSSARDVNLSLPIPSGFEFVSLAAGSGFTAVERVEAKIVGVAENLAVGASAFYEVVLKPTAVGSLTVTATAAAENVDTVPANNTAIARATVVSPPGSLQFALAAFASADNAGNAVITVNRDRGTSGVLAVNYSATAGTAVAGRHFVPVSGTLIFQDGESSQTFTVPILDDGEVTGSKSVILTLTDTGLGSVGPQSMATLEIAETDFDVTGPRVVDLAMAGKGAAINAIVLTFSEALDPARAQNPLNYSLVGTGRARAGGVVPILAPTYDPAKRTVTIIPSRRLQGGTFYHLTLNGSAHGGLTDVFGNALDGEANGSAGSNFVISFARGTNLTYLDGNGDQVSLRLTGGGIIELQRTGDGEASRVRLLGTRGRSILSGTVRRGRDGDGATSLGTVEGLGVFAGGARSRLSTPPFTATNQSVLAAVHRIPNRTRRAHLWRFPSSMR
jgi:uncharacterized repeat protein (TIGR01451 family)